MSKSRAEIARMGLWNWLLWRGGLAIGKAINRVGYRLLDVGLATVDRAADRYVPDETEGRPNA